MRLRTGEHVVEDEDVLQVLLNLRQQAHPEDHVLEVASPSYLALRAKHEEGLQLAVEETTVRGVRTT